MSNILIIGLDDFSKEIINNLKNNPYLTIYGYDFEEVIIDSFFKDLLISNSSIEKIESLLKKSDFIILNVNYLDSLKLFKLNSFIKKNSTIFEINSIKQNREKIKEELKDKYVNFLPVNFFYFPNKILFFYDVKTKIDLVYLAKEFFKKININSIELTHSSKNNVFFSFLYQLPFILNNLFKKDLKNIFIKNETIFFRKKIFFEDLFFNKEFLCKNINTIIKTIDLSLSDDTILNKILESKFSFLDSPNSLKIVNNNIIFLQIILEKYFIYNYSFFINELNYDNNFLNFIYHNYDLKSLKTFIIQNKDNSYKNILTLREKLKTLTSMLEYKYLTLKSFKQIIKLI